MSDLVQMKLSDLHPVLDALLLDLKLSKRCLDVSSAYADYVAGIFFVPRPMARDGQLIEKKLRALCERHGWTELSVTIRAKNNEVTFIMHKGRFVASGDVRMPY